MLERTLLKLDHRTQSAGRADTGFKLIQVRLREVAEQQIRLRYHAPGDVGMQIERRDERDVRADRVANPFQQRSGSVVLSFSCHGPMQRNQDTVDFSRLIEALYKSLLNHFRF